jgi:hypothetical protein
LKKPSHQRSYEESPLVAYVAGIVYYPYVLQGARAGGAESGVPLKDASVEGILTKIG